MLPLQVAVEFLALGQGVRLVPLVLVDLATQILGLKIELVAFFAEDAGLSLVFLKRGFLLGDLVAQLFEPAEFLSVGVLEIVDIGLGSRQLAGQAAKLAPVASNRSSLSLRSSSRSKIRS